MLEDENCSDGANIDNNLDSDTLNTPRDQDDALAVGMNDARHEDHSWQR